VKFVTYQHLPAMHTYSLPKLLVAWPSRITPPKLTSSALSKRSAFSLPVILPLPPLPVLSSWLSSAVQLDRTLLPTSCADIYLMTVTIPSRTCITHTHHFGPGVACPVVASKSDLYIPFLMPNIRPSPLLTPARSMPVLPNPSYTE
jgi:hypothetical protein